MTWQRYWKKPTKKRNTGKHQKGKTRGPQIKTQILKSLNQKIDLPGVIEYHPLLDADLGEATKKIWKERTDMNNEHKIKQRLKKVLYVNSTMI